MLNKIILVFIAGIIETFLYAGYIIAVTKKKPKLSSELMFIYMILYLSIIGYAIKDADTFLLITTYSIACAIGNYIRVKNEKTETKLLKIS